MLTRFAYWRLTSSYFLVNCSVKEVKTSEWSQGVTELFNALWRVFSAGIRPNQTRSGRSNARTFIIKVSCLFRDGESCAAVILNNITFIVMRWLTARWWCCIWVWFFSCLSAGSSWILKTLFTQIFLYRCFTLSLYSEQEWHDSFDLFYLLLNDLWQKIKEDRDHGFL